MSSGNTYLKGLVGLLFLPALLGCAATPLQVVKAEPVVNFQQYTTVVVKDFDSGVGDALPPRVRQDVAEAVVARLNECYPGAFAKVAREATGSPEELVVAGTITEYREGSRFARAMLIGLGSAKFASDVVLLDGQSGRKLTRAKVDLLWAMGGLMGAATGIEDLVKKAGLQVADTLAEKKAVPKAGKC